MGIESVSHCFGLELLLLVRFMKYFRFCTLEIQAIAA